METIVCVVRHHPIARIVRCDAFDDTMIQVERNTILNLQKPIVTTMSSRNTIRFNP